MKPRLLLTLLLALLPAAALARPQYQLDFTVRFLPSQGVADVTIATEPGDGRLTRADFNMPPGRYEVLGGDGEVVRNDERVLWVPPSEGGSFRYRHRIDHRRGRDGYDARITDGWAILRGDDLFPAAVTRSTKGADSRTRLRFELPEGWSSVETQYRLARDGKSFVVTNADRRFDRPTGWIIAGDLGTRRETIEGMEVSVAAPKGDAYPRLEVLGYVNATALELEELGELPSKLLIVGAGDPMWRGGLSAPRSLWMHATRPLISENGTSPLVHELFHVATGIRGSAGHDWIAEGLAEYYAIVLLNRAGLLSDKRRDKALDWMRHHGRKVKTLQAKRSSGRRTARAVALFAELDQHIRDASGGEHRLDAVVRRLSEERGRISPDDLADAVEAVTGERPALLDTPLLD